MRDRYSCLSQANTQQSDRISLEMYLLTLNKATCFIIFVHKKLFYWYFFNQKYRYILLKSSEVALERVTTTLHVTGRELVCCLVSDQDTAQKCQLILFIPS